MNRVDPRRFPQILIRIIRGLAKKVTEAEQATRKVHSDRQTKKKKKKKDRSPFNDEELGQLEEAIGITVPEIRDVIDACCFIFEQSAYFNLKPVALATQLEKSELGEPQVSRKTSLPFSSPLSPS